MGTIGYEFALKNVEFLSAVGGSAWGKGGIVRHF